MGLDMYLFDKDGKEVMYWRKANQIMNWFNNKFGSENEYGEISIGNCEEVKVTINDLISLKKDCDFVLKYKDNAEEVLPTLDGFFFGSVEYDECYYYDLKETSKRIRELIEEYNEESVFTFYAWW